MFSNIRKILQSKNKKQFITNLEKKLYQESIFRTYKNILMKKIFLSLLFIFITFSSFSQLIDKVVSCNWR